MKLKIDCGAAADPFAVGGVAWPVPSAEDQTLRFSDRAPAGSGLAAAPFFYRIPVVDGEGLYMVRLRFVEPSAAPPARAFSVSINDELIFPRLTMPGFLVPFSRSAVVFADSEIVIRFDTFIRSAVVSSIEVEPYTITQYIVPQDPEIEWIIGAIPNGWFNNEGYLMPGPQFKTHDFTGVVYENIAVYLNGLRLTEAVDYQILSRMHQVRIMPITGQQWEPGSRILADYKAIIPLKTIPINE